MLEQEAERRLAGREGQEEVEQAGPGVSDQAVVVGCPLAAAQLLQPPPLGAVAAVLGQGSQEGLSSLCPP